jgi:DUF1009 family protein
VGSSADKKLGLLAGAGALPVLVAVSAKERGYKIVTFGFKDMMSPKLKDASAAFHEFPFARIEPLFQKMEAENITQAITIGGIARTSLIGGTPQFDDLALEIWRRMPDRRVDTIMGILVEELEKRGIRVIKAIDFLELFMAPPGEISASRPSPRQWEDIRFGFKMAKAIGGLDIGQTVVVKSRAVMAVEAIEGTDRAIARGGELAGDGAVVVKVAKPNQDMRFDVPAAGVETLESMRKAGAKVLAMEAGKVLMVDKEAMKALAQEEGISLVGVKENEIPDEC